MDITKVTRPARKLLKLQYCGAVIVAAGTASRMGGIDKVMAQLGGEPVQLGQALVRLLGLLAVGLRDQRLDVRDELDGRDAGRVGAHGA